MATPRLPASCVAAADSLACLALSAFHRGRSLLQASRLLFRALRKIGGGARYLRGGARDLPRRHLDFGNGLRQTPRREIGIVLEIGEGAFVLRRDARGQIALCQRAKDAHDVGECRSDIVAHRVHGRGEVANDAVLAFERDALREVADHRRLDNAAHGGIELVHHLGGCGFAFGNGSAVALDRLRF